MALNIQQAIEEVTSSWVLDETERVTSGAPWGAIPFSTNNSYISLMPIGGLLVIVGNAIWESVRATRVATTAAIAEATRWPAP